MRITVVVRPIVRDHLAGMPSPGADPGAAEVLLHCFNSLLLSLVQALDDGCVDAARIEVLDPGYHSEMRRRLQHLMARCPFPTRLDRAPKTEATADTSNTAQPLAAHAHAGVLPFSHALALAHEEHTKQQGAGELFYFVEADCLHGRTSIGELIREHQHWGEAHDGALVTTPIDDLALYQSPRESILLRGQQRYWRTVAMSPRTMLLQRSVLLRFAELLSHDDHAQHLDDRSKDKPLRHLYRLLPCLAPMPSLAVSLLTTTKSPFVDWQPWYAYAAPDFSLEASL